MKSLNATIFFGRKGILDLKIKKTTLIHKIKGIYRKGEGFNGYF